MRRHNRSRRSPCSSEREGCLLVIYFTGTGNSRYLAEIAAKALEDELVCANGWIKENRPADFHSEKPYVFVCPTYAWQIPRVFEDFLDAGRFSGSADCYFLMDCGGGIGNAQAYLRKLCRRKGVELPGRPGDRHAGELHRVVFRALRRKGTRNPSGCRSAGRRGHCRYPARRRLPRQADLAGRPAGKRNGSLDLLPFYYNR